MSFDLKRSYSSDRKERPTLTTLNYATIEEGMCFTWVADAASGLLKVQPSAGAASEKFAGFAITDAIDRITEVVYQRVTVPGTGPYTVTLQRSNLVGTAPTVNVSVIGVVSGAALTQVAGAPATGEFQPAPSTGILTFNAAQAGLAYDVVYRYTMTAAQMMAKYQQRSVNNTAQQFFNSMSLMCGQGEIFTDQYDVSLLYTLNQNVLTGANGKLTNTGSGTLIGTVSKLPSQGGDGLLGVKWSCAV
jgi:hypothetical protein